ncbi:hypothetical protein OPL79_002053 [Enterococcus faecalis]|nr:hypothetical protein [Enterococcus faecalis]
MSEIIYFTPSEVIEKVEGLNSLSTLNKWANFIQKDCHYTFHLDYGKNSLRQQVRHFSNEEIKKFQEVVYLIPKIGRDHALRKLFDSNHKYNTMNHHELVSAILEVIQLQMHEKEKTITDLSRQYQNLTNQCMDLRQKIYQLEKLHDDTQDHSSSGWFRRKR